MKHSLVVEKSGRLGVGPTLIHLESSSAHVPRHHQNWRLRAFTQYEQNNKENVFYTAPVTLSEKDAKILRERVVKFIAGAVSTIKDSPSEKLCCLCIDWFEV